MSRDPSSVRPLRRDELAAAAHTLALAFDDDPIFRFLLPERRERYAWTLWFHRSSLGEAFAVNGAFTVEEGPEHGAIGFVPPGCWPRPLRATLRAIALPRRLPSWHFIRRGLHIEKRIRALHPAEPHLYVSVLGVHPKKKGQGLGATLLRHAFASATSNVVHLETSNPINLPFYRRFGLEVGGEILSHEGPPVWTLTTPRVSAAR